MSAEKITKVADLLEGAWRDGTRIPLLSDDLKPADLREGFAMQDELDRRLGFETVGWKLGVSSTAAKAAQGLDYPMTGRLYAHCVVDSPASFAFSDFHAPVLEAELAFRIGADLPPREAPYDEDAVATAIECLVVGIEIADNRYDTPPPIHPLYLTADNGASGAYVVGPKFTRWHTVDLVATPADLHIDGELAGASLTGDARCNPLEVLHWTANELSRRGVGLKAGDLITTGTACAPVPASGPGEVVADFGDLGEVRVTLT